MIAKKFLLLMAAVLAIRAALYCQPYYFRHYEVESGLSNNAVMCSVQDKLGFMWFGTRDGLNRFDGHTFKVYRFSNNKNKSSGNNLIHALHLDASGTLWMGTEKDLYRYDAQLDSFIFLVSFNYFPLDEMVSDPKGNIWFNAGCILCRYSVATRQLKIFEPQKFFRATSVSMDKNGILWVSTPDVENSLKIVERNTNRLIELSNQLLDFRKTEIKGYRLSLEEVNISESLSEAHMNFTTLADQNNIHLKTDLPPAPLFAYVDVDAFHKIIYNLISNAVKYAATTAHVSLLPCYKDDHSFTILVKNDGYLIPDHLKEKIFEPFYRIKEPKQKKEPDQILHWHVHWHRSTMANCCWNIRNIT